MLLFLALAEMPASAFYNPNTGRWLNRDPIEERGAQNHYSAFANDTVSKIDPLGLRLYLYDVTWWTLADIQRNFGSFYAVTEVLARPEPTGTDDVREYKSNNGCYCANVFSAKELELIVHSYIPSEASVADQYTESGRTALIGHEGRRKTVIQNGFNAFLAPAELAGSATTRCGEICTKTQGEAERLLRNYLSDLRTEARLQYLDYNLEEQRRITGELTVPIQAPTEGPLRDIINISPIKPPGQLKPPKCPESNCPGC